AWMYALQIALGLALGPKSPLSFAMLADSADYNEWRNGRRATGMTFAASSFAQKVGTAGAVGVIGMLFSVLGYAPNVAQSAESQAGIVWLMSVIPAAFTLLAAVIMMFYSLDNPTMARIQADLAARKSSTPST
ncbi:MAG: MFS transporter, partial [Burkholderiales bacterium]|nr:MFS transporter [Burkholderiales bacterium]